VGAQNEAVIQPESVLHVPRRMIWSDIDRIEIEVLGFDLETFIDPKTHTAEDVLERGLDDHHRLNAPGLDTGREAEVDADPG
jgi:hypothetical protein